MPTVATVTAEDQEKVIASQTKEIKASALAILHAKGHTEIKLSDFSVWQARQLIKETFEKPAFFQAL